MAFTLFVHGSLVNLLKLSALALVASAFFGCNKQSASDGLSQQIQAIVSDDVIESMEASGLVIHRGFAPPNIEGTYQVSPLVLENSNFRDSLPVGHRFDDALISLEEQDEEELSVELTYSQSQTVGGGSAAFLAGDGSAFTIFSKTRSTNNGQISDAIEVLSGEITKRGIENLQWGVFMLDDHGDPANQLLDRGQGRVVRDQDGISPRSK